MNKYIKRSLIIVPTLALAGLAAAGAAMADGKGGACKHADNSGHGHKGKMGHEGHKDLNGKKGQHKAAMGRHMAQQLDLTDAQKDAIKDIMTAAHDGAKTGRGAMAQSFGELAALESGSDAYIAKAKEIGAQQGAAMAQRLIDRANVDAQIMSVLTPEQAEKFQELRAKMAAKRAHSS